MGGRPRTIKDARGRTTKRSCRRCDPNREKPQTIKNFSVSQRDKAGRAIQWSYECKPCAVARKSEWRKNVRATNPAHEERIKAQQRRTQKKWRETHREVEKKRAKAYRDRVKADPKRHARWLESRRIEHHLRQERRGKKTRPPSPKARKLREPRRVPSEPLVGLMEARLAHLRQVDALTGEDEGQTMKLLCERVGVDQRSFSRWRSKEALTCNIGTAERVLLELDIDWHEVYSYDDHSEAFLAAHNAASH